MLRHFFVLFLIACLSVIVTTKATAQSITSGDITGTVTDPSGAVVPNAKVTVTNVSTNASQSTVTTQQGNYRFAFLPQGRYNVNVTATWLSSAARGVLVTAGQPATADIKLQLSTASQTVEVSDAAGVLQTANSDVTTSYRPEMLQNVPNPGGDITYFAQTAPGVVMNTHGRLRQFLADGMPGTSNLFTINGDER